MELNESLLEQLIENRKNPCDWIENNVIIQHPALGSIPFKMYKFQKQIVDLFLAKHFVITLKSRQVGLSTLIQAICLWSAMHYSNYNVLILSAGMRNAGKFLRKIRLMYESLPNNQWKIKLVTDNKQSLEFQNGSTITVVPATRQSSLGESINLLVIDEAAFIKNIKTIYQGAYPTISRAFNSFKGKPYGIILISTPNGVSGTGEWYHEMYEGAIQKQNKYIPVKIHWTAVPEYDKKWYLDQCRQLNWDYRAIASELELSFVSSGNTYVPGQILDSIDITEPIVKDYDDNLWVWELPEKNSVYVAGVDVAYGDKQDSSTIQILNAHTLNQVAEYDCNSITVDKFADVIIKLTRYYNNALVNIERNSPGKILIEKIIDKTDKIGLNFYRDINKNELENILRTSDSYKSYIGTNVTGVSRDVILANMYNIILDKYTEALDAIMTEEDENKHAQEKFEALMSNKERNAVKKKGVVRSERLLHQLLGFVVDEHGRPSGKKDDLVFGWAHSLYAWTKSKAFLLKDIAKVLSNTVGLNDVRKAQEDIVRFMRDRTDSKIWQNLSVEELQVILDEENAENSKINKEKVEEETPLTKIYKSFFR